MSNDQLKKLEDMRKQWREMRPDLKLPPATARPLPTDDEIRREAQRQRQSSIQDMAQQEPSEILKLMRRVNPAPPKKW
jgi:hypothetical protein